MKLVEPPITLMPNKVVFEVTRTDGSYERYESTNARTDTGAQAIAQLIGSAAGLPFSFVGLSSDATAVAKTDTTLTSEYTTNGLARKAVTYGGYVAPSVLNGAASFTQTATWTCTAAAQMINKVAAFTAISSGIMGFATVLGTSVVLNNGDIGSLTWTFGA